MSGGRCIHFNFHGNWAGGAAGAPARFDLGYYAKYAELAERGLFDAVFFAAGVALLVEEVVPFLRKRGLYPDRYQGNTLRAHYGFG